MRADQKNAEEDKGERKREVNEMQKLEMIYEGKAKKVYKTDDPKPVSYTHLDVYKRQGMDRVIDDMDGNDDYGTGTTGNGRSWNDSSIKNDGRGSDYGTSNGAVSNDIL